MPNKMELLPSKEDDKRLFVLLWDDPRWIAYKKYMYAQIEERKEILATQSIVGEDDIARANNLIGEIKALREIAELPQKLASKGVRGPFTSGE